MIIINKMMNKMLKNYQKINYLIMILKIKKQNLVYMKYNFGDDELILFIIN